MRVLVLGGDGFCGWPTSLYLSDRGNDVTILDNLSRRNIDNELEVRDEWLEGVETVGITSGASAPEELVQRLVEFFRARGAVDVSELEVTEEDVRFMLPKDIRQLLTARS